MHDLVRLYAAERGLPGPVREAALTRLVDYYLHTAYAGEIQFLGHRRPIEMPQPANGTRPEVFTDQAAALAWFAAEHTNILLVQRLAAERLWDRAVYAMAWSLSTYHWRRGETRYDIMVWQLGLPAAQSLGAPVATAHRLYGRALIRAGLLDDALDQLQQAKRRVADDDIAERAQIDHTMAWLWENRGDDRAALKHAQRGLELFAAAGDPLDEARAYNAVGWYQARLGDFEAALANCTRALEMTREQDRAGQYGVLDSLGFIARGLGRYDEALDCYDQALALNHELGNIYLQADIMSGIGAVRADIGDPAAARQAWGQAIELYRAQHRQNDVERVHRLRAALDEDCHGLI
ncbi:tetratricopeptide repeat protein, partial [Kutzneria sp. NPDC051319]|uniref:tetratricopeptide repeat protein n=1 Tax=Kutzneria sp. NPDC051319 TaxID=3155047 RepID=UPI0034436129